MKKKKFGFAAMLLAGLLVLTGIAFAHGSRVSGFGMGFNLHDEIEGVIEEGKYSDLIELRQELGFNIMPWVDSEDDFKQAEEMHEAMEEFHEKYGYGMMGNYSYRMMNNGFRGMGCYS